MAELEHCEDDVTEVQFQHQAHVATQEMEELNRSESQFHWRIQLTQWHLRHHRHHHGMTHLNSKHNHQGLAVVELQQMGSHSRPSSLCALNLLKNMLSE